MIQKIIDKILYETEGNEYALFEIEVENTFVSGVIRRQYVTTWGGSYLSDREDILELISSEIEIFEIEAYDEDGNQIDPPVTAYELQKQFIE